MSENRAAGLAPGRRHPSPLSRPLDYWLLWLVVIGSLALNLYLVRTLLDGQRQASMAASRMAEVLESMKTDAITYSLEIDESIPVNFNVEVDDVVQVPVSTTVPIDMVVSVPMPGALGFLPPLAVPIKETIPVSFTTAVPINLTVPISDTAPVRFNLPVEIALADTPLAARLMEIEQIMNEMAHPQTTR